MLYLLGFLISFIVLALTMANRDASAHSLYITAVCGWISSAGAYFSLLECKRKKG